MQENMKKVRLMSLDALRGFDMFFITGGANIVIGLCAGLGFGDCWIAQQMKHVSWAGLAHHDTIFPLFLFLAGVSWPFSLASQEARGRMPLQIHLKVTLRMVTLFALGMTIGGILKFSPPFRIPSVLGQIGLSWGIAALLFMHVRKPIFRGLIVAAILIGNWMLMAFTGAPDAPIGADLYSKEWNVISWLDRTVMPNYIYRKGIYDPESLFSLPSGVALALLGMSAGSILKTQRWSGARKTVLLVTLSGTMLSVGLFFIHVLKMPIVKALWTSSFVLVAAAYSFAMLALFYWIVDVKGWNRWTFYFRVIGMNSITVYMLMAMGVITALYAYCLKGLVGLLGTTWSGFGASLGYQLTCWLVLYFLYKRGLFLKV